MKKIWSRLSAVQRICAGICIFYFLAAAFGPIFSPFPPDDFSSPALLPPGRVHLLGTDEMGHDIFSMVLSGFRYTLLFSLTAALGSVSPWNGAGVCLSLFSEGRAGDQSFGNGVSDHSGYSLDPFCGGLCSANLYKYHPQHDIFFLAAGLPDRKVQAFRLFFLR